MCLFITFNLVLTVFIRPSFPLLPRCAFVNFKDRPTAELAAQAWANGLDIDGTRVTVKWARSKAERSGNASSSTASSVKAGPSSAAVDSS